MTRMTLYCGPFGAKAQIAILEKGLSTKVVMVPFTMDHRYEPSALRVDDRRDAALVGLAGEAEQAAGS